MTDDIVARLRMNAEEAGIDRHAAVMEDAAVEIKRLRHQLERERTTLAHIKESRIFWIDMARRYAAVLRDG